MHCCELRSIVVNALAIQPSHPGSIRAWVTNAWYGKIRSIDAVRRNDKGNARSIFFFAWKPFIAVRIGAAMPAWEIAITWQQLFRLWKRRTITLECGSLRKFWMTSSSWQVVVGWIIVDSWVGMDLKIENETGSCGLDRCWQSSAKRFSPLVMPKLLRIISHIAAEFEICNT